MDLVVLGMGCRSTDGILCDALVHLFNVLARGKRQSEQEREQQRELRSEPNKGFVAKSQISFKDEVCLSSCAKSKAIKLAYRSVGEIFSRRIKGRFSIPGKFTRRFEKFFKKWRFKDVIKEWSLKSFFKESSHSE